MLQYKILSLLAALLARVPWKGLRSMAGVMGWTFWHFFPSRRNEAIRAIERHLSVPHGDAKRIARQSFTENFLSFLEIFHAGHFVLERYVSSVDGQENRAALEAETAPLVIATAHIGSWEMMPGLASDTCPHRKSMVVVRSQKNQALNRLLADLRGARGMLAVNHRHAAEVVLPGLREGCLVAFLVDHNTSRKEAVFLPFLNDVAAVNAGPAFLALRAKAVVYPVFLLRDGKGGHILRFFPGLRTADLAGSIQDRVRTIAAYYTDAVAEVVREYPEQWFWMHRRWKTREK